ncbi:hypothetical protein XAC2852_260068 [Xanthomonas citri pv. citri]|nr:hypothetical protein XAC2852_260068 [Xanthomonas citri pv. citri]
MRSHCAGHRQMRHDVALKSHSCAMRMNDIDGRQKQTCHLAVARWYNSSTSRHHALQPAAWLAALGNLVAVVARRAEVGGEHFDPAAGLAKRSDVGSDALTTERLRLTFAASDAGLGFLLGRGTCHVASCSGEVR